MLFRSNRSIADRYTLRLIREGIETTYKKKLEQTLENIETLRGSITKEELFSHQKYVKVLVKYIIDDFDKSRTILDDNSIGAMIVCDSSKQARAIFEEIKESKFSSALILHDEDDSVVRRLKRNEFRNGEIDFLIVYNMLLTGFDAPRLKKMYLGRLIKDHSLLQALTRVNRPYNKFRYGYVVDFADIRSEFDKTNKAYFEELQAELGDEFKQYNNIFKTVEEIENNLKEIVDKLFIFETENAEIFSKQVSKIEDKMELIDLREALLQYKELFNISKIFGYEGLMEKFNLSKVNILFNEVNNRINLINLKNRLHNLEDMSLVLNIALDEIDFSFKKISENEMIIADKFRDSLELTRKAMQRNLDPKDPEYVSLLEELQRLLSKKHIEELNAEEMTENISILNKIRKLADKKNLVDQMLVEKYDNDPKFMRTHKRLKESPPSVASEAKLYRILINLKHNIDNQVISNKRLLNNEPYFINDIYRLVKQELDRNEVQYTIAQIKFIGSCISNEYINERDWVN